MEEMSYLEKSMFGCRGCYLHGRLVLVLASRKEAPWKGVLIPTEKSVHDSLKKDFPDLEVHPVLGKWLYLREDSEDFEETVSRVVEAVAGEDERIGVEPKERKRRRNAPGKRGR